jgi:hypothetical protein
MDSTPSHIFLRVYTNLSTSESLFFFQRDGRQSSCQGRSEDGTDADTNHNPKDGEESTQD